MWVSKSTTLITILGRFFASVEYKRRNCLLKGRNLTFSNCPENHVGEQIDYAYHDSGEFFRPCGVQKEKLSPQREKFEVFEGEI